MPLYAADIESLAKPVKKTQGKKRKAEEASVLQEETPEVTPEPEVKAKKPPTEKQLAARAKFAENRKKKLEEQAAEKLRLEKEIADKQKEIEEKEAAINVKKQARAEKRKMKKDEKEIEKAVDEAIEEKEPKVKVQKAKKDDTVPPAWFERFVEGAKMEEAQISAEKKPLKQVKAEAKEVAHAHWGNGVTRDRVNNEMNSHMNRMYSMIFRK